MTHAHHAAIKSFWVSAALLLAALVYLRGWLLVRRFEADGVKARHAGFFLVGLFFIWFGVASPLAALDHELLTAHMVQHLLLMTLAPPLILFSAPVKPLLYGLWQPVVQIIARPFRAQRFQKLGSALVHPAVCWLGAAGTLVMWHIPLVFMLGLRSEYWHGVEQISFLATGLLFWWPVVQPSPSSLKWPQSSILLYLFLATLPCDVLSGFLVFCDRVVYPVYFSSSRPFGFSALEDQQCAGALMWTCVTVVFLVAGAILTARLLSPHFSEEPSILPSESQSMALPRSAGQSMGAV
jgi:putative membrane protein